MFEVEGIHHVSLSVLDINRAKKFYSEVLGFQELKRPPFDFPGAWYQIGDQQLHLIENHHAKTMRGETTIDSRDGHMAIRVKDYHKTLAYLQSKGVEYKAKPDGVSGFAQIFCADPDGNLIEFNVDQSEL